MPKVVDVTKKEPLLEQGDDNGMVQDNSNSLLVCILTGVVAVAAFEVGWTLGFSGSALPPMTNPNSDSNIPSPLPCLEYDTNPKSSTYGLCTLSPDGNWFGSLLNLGCMAGALIGGALSDKLGRRSALTIAMVPFTIGFGTIGAAPSSVALLIVARILCGIGGGITILNVPLYIAETAPPRLRGALGCVNQLGIVTGIFFVYLAGLATETSVTLNESANLDPTPPPQDFARWNLIACSGTVFAAIFIVIGLAILPETPKWLVTNGQEGKAQATLLRLRGEHYNVNDEIEEQKKAAASDSDSAATLTDLLAPDLRKQVFVGCGLMVGQQLSGINAVVFYSTSIFMSAGVSGGTGSVIVMGSMVVFTAIGAAIIENLGRRVLLLGASAGMLVSCVLMALFYFLESRGNQIGALALFSVVSYIVFFSIGMGAIPWVIMSEIYPARVRGLASSIATCVNWTCAFIITLTFASLNAMLGNAVTFLLFAGILFLTILFILKYVPETKGKTLEEIQECFRS